MKHCLEADEDRDKAGQQCAGSGEQGRGRSACGVRFRQNSSKDKKEPLEYHIKFLSWEIKYFYAFMHIIRIKESQIRATVVGYTLKYFQKRMQ